MSVNDDFDTWIAWPKWAKDAIVVETDVHLSFLDAVRVFWKRKLTVTSKTFTSGFPERTHSLSRVSIEPWTDGWRAAAASNRGAVDAPRPNSPTKESFKERKGEPHLS